MPSRMSDQHGQMQVFQRSRAPRSIASVRRVGLAG
jgi:hypothetical protein